MYQVTELTKGNKQKLIKMKKEIDKQQQQFDRPVALVVWQNYQTENQQGYRRTQ